MFDLFRDLIMGYRPLQDVLVEIPMKERVGNNKNVSRNVNDNEGALIEISKERVREQTLNRVMGTHTHNTEKQENSKSVSWKDEVATMT